MKHRGRNSLVDFVLNGEISRVLDLLDEKTSGTIRLIEVRNGIPRRMLVEMQEYGIELARTGRSK